MSEIETAEKPGDVSSNTLITEYDSVSKQAVQGSQGNKRLDFFLVEKQSDYISHNTKGNRR